MPRIGNPSAPVAMSITGLAELQRALAALPGEKTNRALGSAAKNAAELHIVPTMRSAAPRLEGSLGNSVRALSSAVRTQIAVGNNTSVPYAGPINFGWAARNIRPQEFIYSSIAKETEDFLNEYWKAIDTLVSVAFPIGKLA